jgi:hypothetical protein
MLLGGAWGHLSVTDAISACLAAKLQGNDRLPRVGLRKLEGSKFGAEDSRHDGAQSIAIKEKSHLPGEQVAEDKAR